MALHLDAIDRKILAALQEDATLAVADRAGLSPSPCWMPPCCGAAAFCRHVAAVPEVVEFHRMSGTVDYLLRVVVPDIAAYDSIDKRVIAIGDLLDVSSSFSMERIKYTTALPTHYAD